MPVIAAAAAPADVLYSDAWFKEASLGDWWEEADLRAIVDALSGLRDGRFDAVTEVG